MKKINRVKSIIVALAMSLTALTSTGISTFAAESALDSTSECFEIAESATSNPRKIIDFEKFTTEGKYDCWKACMKSLVKYYRNYTPTNQDFLNAGGYYFSLTNAQPFVVRSDSDGNPNVLDIPLSIQATPYFLDYLLHQRIGAIHDRISNSEIKALVDANRPAYIHMTNSNPEKVGHAVLMVGYEYSEFMPDVLTNVLIYDPFDGKIKSGRLPSETGTVTFNTESGGYFTWADTFVI